MALLDEVISETTNRVVRKAADSLSQLSVPETKTESDAEQQKPRRRKRRSLEDMTKEEREAWLQKKRDEEEARYLGKEKHVKRRIRRRKASADVSGNSDMQIKKRAARAGKSDVRSQKSPSKNIRPKMLQPLEPLYMLKIPGLPKGDCIAICYARGVDQ